MWTVAKVVKQWMKAECRSSGKKEEVKACWLSVSRIDTYIQHQITLLLRSVEANDKLSVCMCVVFIMVRTNTASAWKVIQLKSICLGCTTIYHMTNYGTIEMCFIVTSGNFVLVFEGLKHLHENKQKQLDNKAFELKKGEVDMWSNLWVNGYVIEYIFRKKLMRQLSLLYHITVVSSYVWMWKQNITELYCKWEQFQQSHTPNLTLTTDNQNSSCVNLT